MSQWVSLSKSSILFSFLAITGLVCVLAVPIARAANAGLSDTDSEAIENLLKRRSADLASARDKDGIGYQRGTYSKTFKRVDASTYVVSFHEDTIEKDVQPDTADIKTQRFEVTVKKDAEGRWSIAKSDLKDTFVGLYRGDFGGEWIYKFDALSFEKEGLKVSATNGWAYAYRRMGQTTGFAVFADDLKYEYMPPSDTPETRHYPTLMKKLAKDNPGGVIFKPERLTIGCDPNTCASFVTTVFTGMTKAAPPASGHRSGAQSRMIKRLDDQRDETIKDRKDNPFGGFSLADDPDNRSWSFTFKRDGAKDYYASLDYDNFAPWQVSFYATDYDRLFAYYSEDTRNRGIDPLVLEEREDLDARDFDLVGLKGQVDLSLDDPSAYAADVTFKLKIKRELKVLPFAIARFRYPGEKAAAKNPKLFVNSVQDGDGNELTWTRYTSFGGLVALAKTMKAGDVISLRLQFLNIDAIYELNPYFLGMSREGWLPFVRFGDFIDEFDLTTRVADKYQILGVGHKASETTNNGIRVTRWTSESPVNFPSIVFGVYMSDDAGDYQAKKRDGTVIPVRVYVDKGTMSDLDVRGSQLRAVATQAAVAVNLFEQIFGTDYPFAKLDLVADPGFSGAFAQSPASLIYLNFSLFRGEGAVAGGANASYYTKLNKDTVAHETGHQWWGSLVTLANYRNQWFTESLAELASAIYVEQTQGKKQYLEKVAGWRKFVMENDPLNSVQDGYMTWSGPGWAPTNYYDKGPYAFHVFRSTFGDEKFYAFLKELAEQFQHQGIVTRQIQEVMEKVVGGNMDWFFDQWLRGVGTPQYAISWTKRKNEQGKWVVEGGIKQRVVMGEAKTELPGVYYRAVAPLSFVDLNGKETKATKPLLVQGAETSFRVIVAEEPEQVYFNKDGEILAEDLLINQSW